MAGTYNVFISWSGERSKKVAAALYDWLPMVVQAARPWMSEEDIEKGSRGLEEIGKALESISVGIICLTPENLERPWILFEAGALSKALGEKTRVCPYLFGDLRAENVKPPLGMFQATRAVKEDTRKLVSTVNRVLAGSLVEEKLDTLFEGMWGVLEEKLNGIGPATGAVAPQRSERDMLAEVLELSRAGASKDALFRDALGALVGGMSKLVGLANEAQVPVSAFSGVRGGTVPLTSLLGPISPEVLQAALAGGSPIAAGPEGASPEDRAARARRIRSIREDMEREKRAADKPKKGSGEKK